MATATLAGGCFWCLIKPFDQWDGVNEIISGYSNGDEPDPTYAQVSTGETGHVEAVQIDFDENTMSYRALLEIFFKTFDPTDIGGQFGDRGPQYMPAIFYHDENQHEIALQVIKNSTKQKFSAHRLIRRCCRIKISTKQKKNTRISTRKIQGITMLFIKVQDDKDSSKMYGVKNNG